MFRERVLVTIYIVASVSDLSLSRMLSIAYYIRIRYILSYMYYIYRLDSLKKMLNILRISNATHTPEVQVRT